MKRILLIGPQGSGKSTQAKLLGEYLQIPVISTGDIFRKLMQEDTDLGRTLKNILSEGKLVDDQITSKIVQQKLSEPSYQNGFVMDGYPRNIEQVNIFDPRFEKVIYLKVPDEEVTKRLMARAREDDTPEAIGMRLNLYKEQTQPLLDYYQNKGILAEISGMGSIEGIQAEMRKQF